MKIKTVIALVLSLSLAGVAHAQRTYDRWGDSHHSNYGDRHDRYQPIQLNLRYKANGSQRIPLRRLIQSQHNIDTRDYRIRTVTIRNKARYDACADLRVGDRSTGPVYLQRGITTLNAPRGRSDGRWMLQVDAARVRGISIVLEPKRRHASFDRRDDRRYAHNDQGYVHNKGTLRSRFYFRSNFK